MADNFLVTKHRRTLREVHKKIAFYLFVQRALLLLAGLTLLLLSLSTTQQSIQTNAFELSCWVFSFSIFGAVFSKLMIEHHRKQFTSAIDYLLKHNFIV